VPVELLPLADRAAAVPFAGMTYPHFVPALLAVAPDGPGIAIGATDPQPCGLVLVQVHGADALVRSVLVKATHRKQGIGTLLLKAAEEAARARGATHLSGTYPAGKDATPAVERVLAKCGWDAPTPSMYLYTLPIETAAAPRTALWLQPRDWPAGFELVQLTEVPREALDEVAGRVESGEVPASVSPFLDPDAIAPDLSFALMKDGRMGAWAVIHRVNGVYRCTALYADPKAVPPGVGLQLLGRTYWQWLELVDGGDPSPVSFGIHAANPFLRVFQRRVLPSMPGFTLTVTMTCSKSL
jgi:GNAT superfamily N-acetyltransferase